MDLERRRPVVHLQIAQLGDMRSGGSITGIGGRQTPARTRPPPCLGRFTPGYPADAKIAFGTKSFDRLSGRNGTIL